MGKHEQELKKTSRYYEWQIEEVCAQSESPRDAQFCLSVYGYVWTHPHFGKDKGSRSPTTSCSRSS